MDSLDSSHASVPGCADLVPRLLPATDAPTVAAQLADRHASVPILYFTHCSAKFRLTVMMKITPITGPILSRLFSTFAPFPSPQPAPQAGGHGQCPLRCG
jgi:hypothetical protein